MEKIARGFKLIRYALAGWGPLRLRECVACGSRVARFMPYRGGADSTAPLMWALGVVGSDVENFECPRCGASDRERHLMLYLRALGVDQLLRNAHVLHFAPEKRLREFIATCQPARHVLCDLNPASSGVQKIDMLDIPFQDETFDFVVANHVLEHVSDDIAAMGEVRRVLKVGGQAILQTPFAEGLRRTWSDPAVVQPAARFHAYGQEDHVRLFGMDIIERAEAAGLRSAWRAHADALPGVDADRYGVNVKEPFMRFTRLAAGSAQLSRCGALRIGSLVPRIF